MGSKGMKGGGILVQC